MKTLKPDEKHETLLMLTISTVALFCESTLSQLPQASQQFINDAMSAGVPLSVTFELKGGGVTVSASLHTTELTPLFFVSIPPPAKEENHILN